MERTTEQQVRVALRVNGAEHERAVAPRLLLSDFLRHELGLTGTHVGCEHGVCGACTVLFDGDAVRSCLMLAVQAAGHDILTVEGLTLEAGADPDAEPAPLAGSGRGAGSDRLHPLQAAFREAHALQCGFCTPGILMTLVPFLAEHPRPTARQVREALSGNLCRCTGYQHIVDAVMSFVGTRHSAPGAPPSGRDARTGR